MSLLTKTEWSIRSFFTHVEHVFKSTVLFGIGLQACGPAGSDTGHDQDDLIFLEDNSIRY